MVIEIVVLITITSLVNPSYYYYNYGQDHIFGSAICSVLIPILFILSPLVHLFFLIFLRGRILLLLKSKTMQCPVFLPLSPFHLYTHIGRHTNMNMYTHRHPHAYTSAYTYKNIHTRRVKHVHTYMQICAYSNIDTLNRLQTYTLIDLSSFMSLYSGRLPRITGLLFFFIFIFHNI